MWVIKHSTIDYDSWDLHYGTIGIEPVLECKSKEDAEQVAELLNRLNVGPDANSVPLSKLRDWQKVI